MSRTRKILRLRFDLEGSRITGLTTPTLFFHRGLRVPVVYLSGQGGRPVFVGMSPVLPRRRGRSDTLSATGAVPTTTTTTINTEPSHSLTDKDR